MKKYSDKSIAVFGPNQSDECKKIISESRCLSTSRILAPSLKKFWITSFIDTYGASHDSAISIVYENGIPRLILPFQRKYTKKLEFLCDETSDYNDFLYDEPDLNLLQYCLDYWASHGIRQIRLDRVPADSMTVTLLNHASLSRGWKIHTDNCDTLPIIEVNTEIELQKWNGVKPDCVKRYIRKEKTLNKSANVSYSFIETESQLIKEFPAIRDLHIQRWKSIGIHSKYLEKNREAFIINICENAIKEGSLFFPIMRINDILSSYIIGFRGGDTIFDWNTSFSLIFKKWSPGALLLLHILSNSRLYGFQKYNLMKGMEKHKFIWTDKCENNLTIDITIT